ncbi:phage tail protein [Escherichia coli]|uniref:phage tail protein n=1 Tax=Escherichia coli TaxID=562 RepID=UPI0038CD2316
MALRNTPTGWLKCNGAAFSSEMYPKLAKAYPTNKLPDLRGEFIVAGMMGAGLMRDVPCFQGRMVQVFLITQVILTLGLVIQSITMTKSFLTNLDFPVFHLQVLREAMGLIM